jgi:hypothetical protein
VGDTKPKVVSLWVEFWISKPTDHGLARLWVRGRDMAGISVVETTRHHVRFRGPRPAVRGLLTTLEAMGTRLEQDMAARSDPWIIEMKALTDEAADSIRLALQGSSYQDAR